MSTPFRSPWLPDKHNRFAVPDFLSPPETASLFGSGAGPVLNPLAVPGLSAFWDFKDGSGLVLGDRSGNGFDATLGLIGNPGLTQYQPTWGGGALSFNGFQTIQCPLGCVAGIKSLQVVCEVGLRSPDTTRTLFRVYPSTALFLDATDSRPQVSNSPNGIDATLATPASAVRLETGWAVVTVVDDGGGGRLYVNGVEVPHYLQRNSPFVGWFWAGAAAQVDIGSDFNASFGHVGKIATVLVSSEPLSAAQVAGLQRYYAADMAARGITLGTAATTGRTLVCYGTSITAGYGSDGTGGYPARIRASLTQPYAIRNFGRGASSSADALADGPALDAFRTGPNDVCVLETGTNNSFSGQAAADVATWVSDRLAAGWWRVGVTTGLPRTGTDAARATFNASVRALASSQVFVVDWASDSTMGPDGANLNPTYYGDGLHPTEAGYDILAPYGASAINALD